ncbi:MAG: oxygen-independent coproporphyrinogen III oxidase [Paucibacter sp.]|nr:oxygen-independent coproporphyrinogen III oxidase [Roseateles sp.]
MNTQITTELDVLPASLISRLDMQGPRYTSYPTADRFVEAFGESQYRLALEQRAQGAACASTAPLSIYVHIPFCESICYYCACNKIVTRHHERAAAYLDALEREIELHVQVLGDVQPVSQIHFGGGTPTFLSDAELARLMIALQRGFRLQPGAEISIEVDPRTVSRQRLEQLAALGFNRLSFGVQDFDPAVQQAVHRVQPYEQVAELMQLARQIGFRSLNVDLIYGLPRQTPASFARSVEQVARLRPDRIALYAYAHLPQRFRAQRRIHIEEMPLAGERLQMIQGSIAAFLGHGYSYIGMDHFALPEDSLAQAKRQGRLHRNFQGYSTHADCDLIGLGVSAIGRIGATYSQNHKTLDEYYDALQHGRLPTARGLALTRDDLLRRAVIMALMCQGRVDFESIEQAHLISFAEYFQNEIKQLETMESMGLVQVGSSAIELTAAGWFFVRAAAMVFDRHLQADRAREQFSRII